MQVRYFDNAATTKVKDEVINAMFPYFGIEYGNPSSMYGLGRSAKRAIEEARKNVAELINADSNEIYFTAGGSESDNTAIKGIAQRNKNRGNHIITSKIEHPAVLNSCKSLEKQGFNVTYLNVDENGFVDLEQLKRSITSKTIFITIMFANNEVGTIQPIEEISKIAKQNNIIFHTDAVQACGNVPIDVKRMGIDMLSLSGHKINAPKGIGALYVKNGIEFEKIIDGGHQEKGKRAGTENVPGIVGLGKACKLAKKNLPKHMEHLKKLRDYCISQIEEKIPNVKLNGAREIRLPGNVNFSFDNIEGEALLLRLDQEGICASSGSACSTGSPEPSHVLVALGLPSKLAYGSLRLTFGDENKREDINFLIKKLQKIVKELGGC